MFDWHLLLQLTTQLALFFVKEEVVESLQRRVGADFVKEEVVEPSTYAIGVKEERVKEKVVSDADMAQLVLNMYLRVSIWRAMLFCVLC